MPVKRTRRASASPSGPTAGERLKRAKLAATCGLSKYSPHPLCPNKYAKPETNTLKKEQLAAGELEDDIIVISDDECSPCTPKGCRSNPNCLNYLGQERWEVEDKAFSAFMRFSNLGDNPILLARDPGTPVGLKNLGATCYANAFLQVWFQDTPFRRGVYQCLPSTDEEEKFEESPIFQLQVTFAAMQESIQSAFNPIRLVESLKLRTTEQQDAQEFSKLFMAHLDSEFQKQTLPGLKSLLADQFQGKQVYGTECSVCHTRSERDSEFLEIEVNLPNNSKLEDRIAALLTPEELSGDNKYLCSVCDELRDAKRYTEFRQLPPVLHVSLLRFVFDLSSLERKKSKHTITFPLTLDMEQFLGSQDDKLKHSQKRANGEHRDRNVYHLRGVLLHKGPSAYHGHYEAQVYDVTSKSWYQFNDETVTKTPSLVPKANTTQANGTKAKKPTNGGRPKKRVWIEDSDVEVVDGPSSSPAEETKVLTESGSVSSKDAYMLVYARMPSNEGPDSAAESDSCSLDVTPPPRALQVVNALNAEFDKACDEFAAKEKEARENFNKKRRMVMDIYRSWSLSSYDEDSGIVSRQALESWLSHSISKPLDVSRKASDDLDGTTSTSEASTPNGCPAVTGRTFSSADITCPHGRLDPNNSVKMKRVRQSTLDRIAAEDHAQFVPSFKPSDVCEQCVEATFNERLYQMQHPKDVAKFDEVDYVESEGRGYWVSKAWLKDWKLAKPKMHTPSQPDPAPDDPYYMDDVMCEHGGLVTNSSSRRRISAEAYQVLKGVFPDLTAPHATHEACAVCEALVQISKEDRREIRKQAEVEKAKLKILYDYGAYGLTDMPEGPCAVVPEIFMRCWRQWLLRPTEAPRPELLDNSRFLCRHGKLSFDPNIEGDIDGIAYVKLNDWNILEEMYSGGPLIALENIGDRWVHELLICDDCRKERKSTFETTEVTIHVLKLTDSIPTGEARPREPQATAEPSTTKPLPRTYGSRSIGGVRQSKRIRQAKKQERQSRVTISRSTTVKELKMKIQDELDIPTIYQRLYYRGKEVDDNSAEIVALGVLSNDVLYLKEDSEDVDMLDTDDDNVGRKPRDDEGRGFGGTLLGGEPHKEPEPKPEAIAKRCSACTFDNSLNATACEICSTPLERD
ncbi:unnamed protein product [Somion occarium]|uniref:Ubiquitinyl hydrolase 1 n=1 Tax=Somion occarium TaxID=3059160 RepID=A0ABP1D9Q6_9APHY